MSIQKIGINNAFASKRPAFASTQTTYTGTTSAPVKSNKSKIVLTGFALAALGGLLYLKRGALKLTKPVIQKSAKQIEDNINFLKDKYRPDAQRVLNENTHNGMVNLGVIENAAGIRSASPTEQNAFHQAASWIEEAYIGAYSKAQLSDGNNILNYIHRRIGTENNTLAQMYAQMPKEEYTIRLTQFANEAANKDKHVGMTPEKFILDMVEKLIPKAKETLEL